MKKVLLTGASGFVGSHTLIHLLHNTDWDITVICSFRHKGLTDRIRQMVYESHPEYIERVHIFVHDLTVPISATLANQIGKIDYIINMASESHVDRSITDPRPFIENNINLVLTMLEYAREHPVNKFIQISTDEVYGPADIGHDHVEGEPHLPSNPYSASKAAQEDICYSYWRTFDMPIIITNTMNIIGELQDHEKFVPMVIQKVANGETVTIHASADGIIGSRFYLHARNQADALMFMLKRITPNRYMKDGVISKYNVVGEKELNNLEVAQLIAQYAGKELKYEFVDFHSSRPGHDLRYALDGTKLKATGWTPPIPLELSLEQTVKWSLEHPGWMI
jgi:dTDP-glucose 4,6-dehydratase